MRIASAQRALPVVGVILAALAAGVALVPAGMWGYDSWIMYQVAHSIVSEGSFRVYDDALNLNLPYSSYGIGMSLLMVVPELLSGPTGVQATKLSVLINPVLLGLIAAVVWLMARRAGLSTRQAAATSLIICLGTSLLPFAVSTFSEVAVALGVALCLLGVQLARSRPLAAGLIAGAGIGLAILMRTDSLILIAPVIGGGILVAAGRRWSALLGLTAACLPAIVITGIYNQVRFGSPLASQYQGQGVGHSFSQPFWTGFYGLTASPGRGLLLYVPLTLIVAVSLKWTWQRSPVLTVVCLVLLVDRVFFYSSWWAWHGGVGWGPRFLVPAMPALAPFVNETVRRLPTAKVLARLAFGALVAGSLAIQVVGAATDPAGGRAMAIVQSGPAWDPARGTFMTWMTSPEGMATWDRAMLTWSASPLRDHTRDLLRHRNVISENLYAGHMHPWRLAVAGFIFLLGLVLAWRRPVT